MLPVLRCIAEIQESREKASEVGRREKEWFLIERRSCPAGYGLHRLIPGLAPLKRILQLTGCTASECQAATTIDCHVKIFLHTSAFHNPWRLQYS